jgi:hypothetical protein
VLRLLEALRDDAAPYVQRSVANNLNDIGKDHPGVLVETCARWMRGAPPSRQWIVRHALRGAVKRGDPRALAVLGFGGGPSLVVSEPTVAPGRARVGGRVEVAFTITNPGRATRRAVVDFRIHYVKANGRTAPKVFKLRAVELAAGESLRLAKAVSLADMTTRRHHPGRHEVEAWIDGRPVPLGAFELRRGAP